MNLVIEVEALECERSGAGLHPGDSTGVGGEALEGAAELRRAVMRVDESDLRLLHERRHAGQLRDDDGEARHHVLEQLPGLGELAVARQRSQQDDPDVEARQRGHEIRDGNGGRDPHAVAETSHVDHPLDRLAVEADHADREIDVRRVLGREDDVGDRPRRLVGPSLVDGAKGAVVGEPRRYLLEPLRRVEHDDRPV